MRWERIPALHWMYGALITGMVVAALVIGAWSGRIGPADQTPTPTATATAHVSPSP